MHKRAPALLLSIACVLLTVTACQTTGSRKSVPPKLEVLQAAVTFRQTAAGIHSSRAIERCRGAAALAFITEGQTYRKTPVLWSYFFCGAMVLGGHLESERPIIAFYNPFLDGVLLTQWTREDGEPRMLAADLRIASEMAGVRRADPKLAWWLPEVARVPLPEALHRQDATFVNAFAQQYPVESSRLVELRTGPGVAVARTFIENQAAAAYFNLMAVQNPRSPVFHADLKPLQQALRTGDAPALARLMPARNPMDAATLSKQPAWVRQQAVPLYAMIGQGHAVVLLAPAAAPRYCLVAEWVEKPARRLEYLMPFDVDSTPRPATRKPDQAKEEQP